MNKKQILNKDEKKLEEALAKGEFVDVKDVGKSKKLFEEAAVNYENLQKTRPITLRVKNEDLIKVKAKAKRANIPYQRLIGALIRQYAQGETSISV